MSECVLATKMLDLGDLLSKPRNSVAHLNAVTIDHVPRKKLTKLTIFWQAEDFEKEEWMGTNTTGKWLL